MGGTNAWVTCALSLGIVVGLGAGCGDNIDGGGPPRASALALTTAEDTAVTGTLDASDPDGDPLRLRPGAPAHGAVVVDGLRLTYTPAANFSGSDAFDVEVSDGELSTTVTVTVAVGAANDPPVGAADAFATPEDTALVTPQDALTANDTDIDGDALAVTAVGGATNGSVSLAAGVVTFVPTTDYAGPASYVYTLSDGSAEVEVEVAIDVGGENDAPVAVADAASTNEDTAVEIPAADLLANDSDPDGQTLAITAVGGATNGTVALAAGVVTFTPAANFNGAATFSYTITDGAATAQATVAVAVAAVDDPPVAVDDVATTPRDTPLVIAAATLLANDSDIDGPALVITAVQAPSHGTVVLAGTQITFTPEAGYAGPATFDYVVGSGAASDVGRVAIDVVATAGCGNGVIETGETCDDGDLAPEDGCDDACQVEVGWQCSGAPSTCITICGDGIAAGAEQCDDGTSTELDGCTSQCVIATLCDVVAAPGGDRFAVDPATGHCYVAFDAAPTTYAAAQTACTDVLGHLATVTSAAEDAVVTSVIGLGETPWLGATDDANDTDAVFAWVTGEPFSYTRFAPGEPDDDGECLYAVAGGVWADTACAGPAASGRICEIAPRTCGDGVVQPAFGETCDDGNDIPGDGCSASCVAEQVAVFSCTGAAGNEPSLPADALVPGVASLPQLSRGAGVRATTAANQFAGDMWALTPALDPTDYFSVAIAPAAGFALDLAALELDERRSNTGIRTWSVRSSLDGFAADLATVNVPDTDATRTNQRIVLPAAFRGLTTAVELRIYGYAAEATGGTWRVDNVELLGVTVAVP